MADERLTRRERQDAYMFLGILALALLVVVVVLLVRNSWSETQWIALGAVAACVQALGVLVALVYASGQIRTAREEARRQRNNELIDRLDAAVFGELTQAVAVATATWRHTLRLRDIAVEIQRDTDGLLMFEEEYARTRDTVREATLAALSALDRTERVLVLLGQGRKTLLPTLWLALTRLRMPFLPIGVLDPWEGEIVTAEHIDAVQTAEQSLVTWVREYITDHISS